VVPLSRGHAALFALVVVVLLISGSLVYMDVPGTRSDSTFSVSQATLSSTEGTGDTTGMGDQQVNPFRSYSFEPAPIGIADYGLGDRGTPYNYSTSSFLGNVTIDSISMYSPSLASYNVTFQLNVNMVFYYRSAMYDYWVQDVAYLNTSSMRITFIDNIWNLSAPDANMQNSTVIGNGSVSSTGSKSGPSLFYYDFSNSSLPGNNITLHLNSSFQLKVNAYLGTGNSPEVSFWYNDGYGWVIYDNAVFHFASGLSRSPYFYVSGYSYNPANTYYDAELVIGGPGNASETEDLNSSIILMLEYYNGNNYQSVQNAFNFGGDTGETVYDAIGGWTYGSITGRVAGYVQSGLGPLGQLYNSSELSTLKITSNVSSGALYVKSLNSTSKPLNVTSFVGGLINVTLYPGKYSIEIYDFSNGNFENFGNVTLLAGKEASLPNSTYEVNFQERGLPAGSTWSLNVSGIYTGSVTGSQYSIYLHNGTYNFTTFTSDREYRDLNSTGVIVVNGTSVNIKIMFLPVLFNVSFVATGLPAGSTWSVTLNGRGTLNSSNDSIVFSVQNGTYDYVIPRAGDYATNASTGSLTVNGTSITKYVIFQILDGYLTGKIRPSSVEISVNGTVYKISDGNFNISLKPGKYSVVVSAVGYNSYSTSVTITSMNSTHLDVKSLTPQLLDWIYLGVSVIIIAVVAIISVILRRRRSRERN
jgi:hypothetical protein